MNSKLIALEGTEEQIEKIKSFVWLLQRHTEGKVEDKTVEYLYLRTQGLIEGKIDN